MAQAHLAMMNGWDVLVRVGKQVEQGSLASWDPGRQGRAHKGPRGCQVAGGTGRPSVRGPGQEG